MSRKTVEPRADGTAGKEQPVPANNQTMSAADGLPELSDVAVAGKILFQRSISLESADFDNEFDDCYGYADDFSISERNYGGGGGGGRHKRKSKNDNPNGVYSQRHIRQVTAKAASAKNTKPAAAKEAHHSKKKGRGKKNQYR